MAFLDDKKVVPNKARNSPENIKGQMSTADEILKRIKVICPSAFVAGGAPLDWLHKNTAKDIDLFFSLEEEVGFSLMKTLLRSILTGMEYYPIEVSNLTPETLEGEDKNAVVDNTHYKPMEGLRKVLTTKIRDQITDKWVTVQFIELTSEELQSGLGRFSTSICKVAYHGGNLFSYHEDFILSKLSGVAFLNDGYNWRDYHPSKVMNKIKEFNYPYTCGSKKQAVDYLFGKEFKRVTGEMEDSLNSYLKGAPQDE